MHFGGLFTRQLFITILFIGFVVGLVTMRCDGEMVGIVEK